MAGRNGVRDDGGALPEGGPQAPSGPAPIVDLGDNAVPVRPAKPLGPRRLARLQRELEERSRELAGSGTDAPDPELLAKQLRFAELAAQAGAANAGATGDVQAAAPEPAQREPSVPERPESGSSAAEPSASEQSGPAPAHPAEQITVVFPGSGDQDAHAGPDPVHVDPALFSNRLDPAELAALTHIEIVPAGGTERPEEQDVSAARVSVPPAEGPSPSASARSTEDPAPRASARPTEGDAAPPPPAPAPPVPGEADQPPPAAPVSAARAEGLELLDPKEYQRRSGPAWAVLLLSVVAALVVVVVLFVL